MGSINTIHVEELTRNYRLCYDKAGLTIYIVPRKDLGSLIMGNGLRFSNEDIQLYGTKIILYMPCTGTIYGRYLVQINNELRGLYVLTADEDCEVITQWNDQGINLKLRLVGSESLIIIVRLMRIGKRRIKPSNYALRIMKALGLSGRLLYADANHEIQIFRIDNWLGAWITGPCVSEVSMGPWSLVFDKCGIAINVMDTNGTQALLINGINTIVIKRHYPSLGKWYELNKVIGPGNYLVVLN
ncbi:hypothetical protein [Vulcanisaeta souniana]|uniref:Uncharacterized protein n=1 Tax=Vulcanisaeta souniana JCM 11219 TaxID=1293586 RepID=A0A830EJT5_9CREN|nr:hypothetical protein [Vulcanisaeta souniana]BDR92968.1 hypothetical protein Vsou_20610 [Vulcanisaeta souniana JCM 11219]GGI83863.1 hypothetical protein GCM10007112_20890 [Vulcanisaeta souniana JCM 11219]